MTIENTNAATLGLTGNGATVAFDFNFHAASISEVGVQVSGEEVTEGFTVELTSNRQGTVTFEQPPADGATVNIFSRPNFRQEVVFDRFGQFTPDQLNDPLDKSAIRDIALKSETDRALKVPVGSTGFSVEALADGQVLARDGDKLVGAPNNSLTIAQNLEQSEAAKEATLSARDQATAQVPLAAAQVALAANEANSAEAAADRAEAARDSAVVNSNVYATIAEGRAAVADGETFLSEPTGDGIADLHRRTDASNSVRIGPYAGQTDLQNALDDIDDFRAIIGEGGIETTVNGSLFAGTGNSAASNLVLAPLASGNLEEVAATFTAGVGSFNLWFFEPNDAGQIEAVQAPILINHSGGDVILTSNDFGNYTASEGEYVGIEQVTGAHVRFMNGGSFQFVAAADINAQGDSAAVTFFNGFTVALRSTVRQAANGSLTQRIEALESGGTILSFNSDWNGYVTYGQSNSVGADALPIITDSNSAKHLTFGVGPKMTKPNLGGATNPDDGTIKALIEDDAQNTANAMGETSCSRFARGFNNRFDGVTWFASAAGRSGFAIASLVPTAAWYANLTFHVSQAKDAADTAGKSYQLSIISFMQGETDAQQNVTQADYYGRLSTLVEGANDDIKGITGQSINPQWLFNVSPYFLTVNQGPVLAQLQLISERDDCHLVGPSFRYPQGAIHLTASGQALKGEYNARAAAALFRGEKVPRVRWGRARSQGTLLTVYATAPTPIAINTSINGATTDNGFAVVDDTGDLTLSNITIGQAVLVDGLYETPITMTLNRALAANPKLRYGLDSRPANMVTSGGLAGDIYDTTSETVTIDSVSYTMVHAAPPAIIDIEEVE